MAAPTSHGALQAMNAAAAQWEPLGAVPLAALRTARAQLHHAAQIANAPAISYLPSAADDSHTNFEWIGERRLMATKVIPAQRPFRVALRPGDLALLVVDGAGVGKNAFALPGRTVADAYEWLGAQVRAAGLDRNRLTSKKHYEIPPNEVASGAAFADDDLAPFVEMGRWWGNIDPVLRALAGLSPGSADVRLWPHHFDVGTILRADGGSRSIGVGLSPGDEWYDEPYLYVSPYPAPADRGALPRLEQGAHWHHDRWFGAVLTAAAIIEPGSDAQSTRVTTFLNSAVTACRRLLGT